MFRQTLSRMLLVAAVLSVGFVACNRTAQAGCGVGSKSTKCCPKCNHVCKLTAEEIEVEKKCYEVESDYICVPKVVFPWQRSKKSACSSCTSCDGTGCKSCSACPNNGACIRKIKVLKTKKFKCPACEYTWKAEKSGSCCGGNNCGGCGCCSGSGAASCDSCAGSVPTFTEVVNPPSGEVPHAQPVAMQYQIQPMPAGVPVPAPVYNEQVPASTDYYAPAVQ